MKYIIFLFVILCFVSCSKQNITNPAPTPTPTPTPQAAPTGYFTFNESSAAHSSVVVCKFDGSEKNIVVSDSTTANIDLTNSSTRWAFDGSKIIFRSIDHPSGSTTIYTINRDGTTLKPIGFSTSRVRLYPVISPDGQQIAYSGSDPTGPFSIFTSNIDGTNEKKISSYVNPSNPLRFIDASYLIWSPTGKTIYFSINLITNGSNLYSIGVDGTNLKAITNDNATSYWSTSVGSNEKILFFNTPNPISNIYSIDPSGTNQTKITAFTSWNPVWSPDGKYIAFLSNKDKSDPSLSDIYYMDSDGTHIQRVTNTDTRKDYLDWR